MHRGFIKLWRKSFDNSLYLSEPFTRWQAWVDLVALANHKSGHIRLRNGKRIEVKRGQCGWSELALAERWRWSRGKVRRFKNELEESKQIVQEGKKRTYCLSTDNKLKNTIKNSKKNEMKTVQEIVQESNMNLGLITINNYDDYQGNSTRDDTRSSTRDGQETDTNKNVKNVKNDKKEIIKSNKLDDMIKFFNEACKTELRATSKKKQQLENRLKTFSEAEIKKAIVNRTKSAFHRGENPERKIWYKDWDSLFRNDEKIEKMLQETKINPMDLIN